MSWNYREWKKNHHNKHRNTNDKTVHQKRKSNNYGYYRPQQQNNYHTGNNQPHSQQVQDHSQFGINPQPQPYIKKTRYNCGDNRSRHHRSNTHHKTSYQQPQSNNYRHYSQQQHNYNNSNAHNYRPQQQHHYHTGNKQPHSQHAQDHSQFGINPQPQTYIPVTRFGTTTRAKYYLIDPNAPPKHKDLEYETLITAIKDLSKQISDIERKKIELEQHKWWNLQNKARLEREWKDYEYQCDGYLTDSEAKQRTYDFNSLNMLLNKLEQQISEFYEVHQYNRKKTRLERLCKIMFQVYFCCNEKNFENRFSTIKDIVQGLEAIASSGLFRRCFDFRNWCRYQCYFEPAHNVFDILYKEQPIEDYKTVINRIVTRALALVKNYDTFPFDPAVVTLGKLFCCDLNIIDPAFVIEFAQKTQEHLKALLRICDSGTSIITHKDLINAIITHKKNLINAIKALASSSLQNQQLTNIGQTIIADLLNSKLTFSLEEVGRLALYAAKLRITDEVLLKKLACRIGSYYGSSIDICSSLQDTILQFDLYLQYLQYLQYRKFYDNSKGDDALKGYCYMISQIRSIFSKRQSKEFLKVQSECKNPNISKLQYEVRSSLVHLMQLIKQTHYIGNHHVFDEYPMQPFVTCYDIVLKFDNSLLVAFETQGPVHFKHSDEQIITVFDEMRYNPPRHLLMSKEAVCIIQIHYKIWESLAHQSRITFLATIIQQSLTQITNTNSATTQQLSSTQIINANSATTQQLSSTQISLMQKLCSALGQYIQLPQSLPMQPHQAYTPIDYNTQLLQNIIQASTSNTTEDEQISAIMQGAAFNKLHWSEIRNLIPRYTTYAFYLRRLYIKKLQLSLEIVGENVDKICKQVEEEVKQLASQITGHKCNKLLLQPIKKLVTETLYDSNLLTQLQGKLSKHAAQMLSMRKIDITAEEVGDFLVLDDLANEYGKKYNNYCKEHQKYANIRANIVAGCEQYNIPLPSIPYKNHNKRIVCPLKNVERNTLTEYQKLLSEKNVHPASSEELVTTNKPLHNTLKL